ncbi:hypothetical protein CHUAL_003199 [Chamberlinius hualienensis]
MTIVGDMVGKPFKYGGSCLVLVCAQVMTRDDSSGGWVPMGGGGLSNVSVRKRLLPADEDNKHEYLICGKRLSDQLVVLSCVIKKDFQYYKVMPTFHHWRTGDKKFGLTFQTAADARAFDKGVRVAIKDLLEGSPELSQIHDVDVGDDDVFMTVDLPVERGDSQSSSGSSSVGGSSGGGGGSVGLSRPISSAPGSLLGVSCVGNESASPYTHPHANHHYFHRMHYISKPPQSHQFTRTNPSSINSSSNNSGGVHEGRSETGEELWIKGEERSGKDTRGGWDTDKIEIISEPYSYVQFARNHPQVVQSHDYAYPLVDTVKSGSGASDGWKELGTITSTSESLKKQRVSTLSQPTLTSSKSKWNKERKKEKLKQLLHERVQCKHCHELFSEDENERGSCEYAPDAVRSCINKVTCLSCAQCMLYHCMADSEGDFTNHPCSCDRSEEHCTRRWLGLTILSIFVPCLWCYIPLNTCHRCGIQFRICGGRHEAS